MKTENKPDREIEPARTKPEQPIHHPEIKPTPDKNKPEKPSPEIIPLVLPEQKPTRK